jgi:hypothetical protein
MLCFVFTILFANLCICLPYQLPEFPTEVTMSESSSLILQFLHFEEIYTQFCVGNALMRKLTSQAITQNLMMQLLIDGGKDFAVPKSANISSSCGHCNQEFDHMTSQGLHHINTFTQVSVTSE